MSISEDSLQHGRPTRDPKDATIRLDHRHCRAPRGKDCLYSSRRISINCAGPSPASLFVFEIVPMLKLHQVIPTPDWWNRLNQFPDRTTYHTQEWIQFIADTQNATPVFADVWEGTSRVGCFHSLVIRRFGLKILAS